MVHNEVYNKFNYRNVGKYIGQRKNDLMDGNGAYYHYASGSSYKGQWKNGLQEGNGTYYCANGKKHVAQWSKGLPNRNQETWHMINVLKLIFHDI